MEFKRKIAGGVLAVLGFMLSRLSSWNDAFVDFPLALAFAWLASSFCGPESREFVFRVQLVVGYWLTNVLGFVLMHKGANAVLFDEKTAYTKRELIKDFCISLGYTALILLLIKLGALKPIESYFPYT